MAQGDWFSGKTEGGTEVRIPQDPYTTKGPILVDGAAVHTTDRIIRYRDGGTTIIPTTAGRIVRPTPVHPERQATLDGAPLA